MNAAAAWSKVGLVFSMTRNITNTGSTISIEANDAVLCFVVNNKGFAVLCLQIPRLGKKSSKQQNFQDSRNMVMVLRRKIVRLGRYYLRNPENFLEY